MYPFCKLGTDNFLQCHKYCLGQLPKAFVCVCVSVCMSFWLGCVWGCPDITSTIFLNTDPLYTTWHTLHLWHHSQCNYDKTPAKFLTWYSVYMRSHPLNEWQHNDGFWHDTQCICVIKPTWLMTSQHSVLMTPHSAYVWHPLHCRWHCIHSFTSNQIIYDVTSISGMTLHRLYQILHPLYLCHHNLSTDITPNFVAEGGQLRCVCVSRLNRWSNVDGSA